MSNRLTQAIRRCFAPGAFSVLALCAGSVAQAAPPPAPQLATENQGLDITVSWSPVDQAAGYHLFYASNPLDGQIHSVDMGAATSYAGTLWEGASFFVAVTAYNADGSSAYSNVELVQAFDPANLNPQSLPLQFKQVAVDTPVAFLPEDRQVVAARRASVADSVTEIDHEDGLLGMTVHIAPGLIERDNLPLSFCLDLDGICEVLQVWDSEQEAYADRLTVEKVYTDVETSLYLELKLPDSLVDKLRPRLSQPVEYTIRATLLDSPNAANTGVELARVVLVDLPPSDESRRARREGTGAALRLAKELKKTFGSSLFGIAYILEGAMMVYRYTPKDATENVSGALVQAKAKANPQLFGMDVDLLSSTGYFLLQSGHALHAHYDISLFQKLSIVGNDWVFDSSAPKKFRELTSAEKAIMPKPPEDKELGIIIENKPDKEIPGSFVTADVKNLFPEWEHEFKKSKAFLVYIVPVYVEGGVFGKLHADGKIGLKFNKEKQVVLFAEEVGPGVSVGAKASATAFFLLAATSISAELTLLKLVAGVSADIEVMNYVKNRKGLSFSVDLVLSGPEGEVALKVEYPWLEFKGIVPKWATKEYKKKLVKWKAFKKELAKWTIYEWQSDKGGVVKNNESQVSSEGSSEIPEFKFSDEPVLTRPDTQSPWACFYEHENYQGKSLCLPLTRNHEGILSFPLAAAKSGFNDQVSSFKLWGDADFGIHLTVFQHGDYTGHQMNFVTHGEEGFGDFKGFHPEMKLNDQISSLMLRKAAPKLGAWPDLPSNVEPWGAGFCMWQGVNYTGDRECYLDSKEFSRVSGAVGRNNASALRIWAAMEGSFEVYFGTHSATSFLGGTMLGAWLHPGEVLELPILGYDGIPYFNDNLVGAVVRARQGTVYNWNMPFLVL